MSDCYAAQTTLIRDFTMQLEDVKPCTFRSLTSNTLLESNNSITDIRYFIIYSVYLNSRAI